MAAGTSDVIYLLMAVEKGVQLTVVKVNKEVDL